MGNKSNRYEYDDEYEDDIEYLLNRYKVNLTERQLLNLKSMFLSDFPKGNFTSIPI
jgi:hypothetical protein